MDLATFLRYAKEYSDLGWAARQQLENVVLSGAAIHAQSVGGLESCLSLLDDLKDEGKGTKLGEDCEALIQKIDALGKDVA